MNTFNDAYTRACAKLDGVEMWHRSLLERIERVYAITLMEENHGYYATDYHWMLSQLHKQKLCAERDRQKAENTVIIAWKRCMEYGQKWIQ